MNIEQIKTLIENQMRKIFSEERQRNCSHSLQHECVDIMEDFVLGPGKRIRPLSVLAFFIGAGGNITEREDVLRVSCSMEFLHAATLIHDDIMDEDETRRNKPTPLKYFLDKYKNNNIDEITSKFVFISKSASYATSIAIMLGNLLYSMAIRNTIMKDQRIQLEMLDLFSGLNYGQIIDVSEIVTIDDYYLNIMKKTAIFFKTTATIGLMLAERSDEDVENGKIWGEHFGLAFQMRDDLLDIREDESKMRMIGSDIIEGRKTIVIFTALEDNVLNEEEKSFVKKTIEMKQKLIDDNDSFQKLLNILRGKPSQIVQEKIKEHHKIAIEALEKLHLIPEVFEYLKSLTNLLLK